MDDTGYLKLSGFPRRTAAVFAGFQSLPIQNLEKFQNLNSRTLNGFPGIPVKIYKILGKFMDFQSHSLGNSYRISNVFHGVCVDIFWNIAQCNSKA